MSARTWVRSWGTVIIAAVLAGVAVVRTGGPSARAALTQPFAGSGVVAFGDARSLGGPGGALAAPVVALAATPNGDGYWLADADGAVWAFGDAPGLGDAASVGLRAPIIGMAGLPSGDGYWLLGLDGGIFSFGAAAFHGSTGAIALNQPVVGMAGSPSGRGYWLVAADGGIFAFGDAQFYGSTGAMALNAPIAGVAATPTGRGYWLVASDGGVFPFGDAQFYGSRGGQPQTAPIVGLAPSRDGQGYTLAGSDGAVFTYGDAGFFGSDQSVVPTPPVSQIVATPDGGGYWMLDPDGFPTAFTHPQTSSSRLGSSIVAIAAAEVGGDQYTSGTFCNPYGPCEEWCALFATWVWEQAGIPIPRFPFTGDIWTWAGQQTSRRPPTAAPAPGDLVLYGTGPSTTSTSVHVGVVAQVWPDGAIVTVEGDAGPGPYGHRNVVINGPFLPSSSALANGFPIYGYAAP